MYMFCYCISARDWGRELHSESARLGYATSDQEIYDAVDTTDRLLGNVGAVWISRTDRFTLYKQLLIRMKD
jgi:hypothetical protein